MNAIISSCLLILVLAVLETSAQPRGGRVGCRGVRRWSSWGSWSSCSKTCGGGVQLRSRRCLSSPCRRNPWIGIHRAEPGPVGRFGPEPEPEAERRPIPFLRCFGSSRQTRRCNTASCPSVTQIVQACHCPEQCGAGQDIVFLIDGSGSINRNNFNNMVNQVNSFIGTFDLTSDPIQKAQVGIAVFNQIQRLKKPLHTTALPATPYNYPSGGTNIGGAINFARTQIFKAPHDRPMSQNTLVLITDGWSRNAASAATTAKRNNIRIIAIGVGGNVNTGHLRQIVSNPATDMFTTNNFCTIGNTLRKRFGCNSTPRRVVCRNNFARVTPTQTRRQKTDFGTM